MRHSLAGQKQISGLHCCRRPASWPPPTRRSGEPSEEGPGLRPPAGDRGLCGGPPPDDRGDHRPARERRHGPVARASPPRRCRAIDFTRACRGHRGSACTATCFTSERPAAPFDRRRSQMVCGMPRGAHGSNWVSARCPRNASAPLMPLTNQAGLRPGCVPPRRQLQHFHGTPARSLVAKNPETAGCQKGPGQDAQKPGVRRQVAPQWAGSFLTCNRWAFSAAC
jgi:hypothetical protein